MIKLSSVCYIPGETCHVLIGGDVPFYELCTRYTQKMTNNHSLLLWLGTSLQNTFGQFTR